MHANYVETDCSLDEVKNLNKINFLNFLILIGIINGYKRKKIVLCFIG